MTAFQGSFASVGQVPVEKPIAISELLQALDYAAEVFGSMERLSVSLCGEPAAGTAKNDPPPILPGVFAVLGGEAKKLMNAADRARDAVRRIECELPLSITG